MVGHIIHQIANESSSKMKENLLRTNDSPELRTVLQWIYNPYQTTGIKETKLYNAVVPADCANWSIPQTHTEMIAYLKVNDTGNSQDVTVAKLYIDNLPDTEKFVGTAVVTKKMQIGVSVTTLNKIFGKEFIPTITCQLGTDISKVKGIQFPVAVTEKLDGHRRLIHRYRDQCDVYTRNGHIDSWLDDVSKEMLQLPTGYVYDGELLANVDAEDNIQMRQMTASAATVQGARSELIFNIFDMVPNDEFFGDSVTKYITRRSMLDAAEIYTRGLQFVKILPVLGYANNIEEVEEIKNKIWDDKKVEGVMLNVLDAPYMHKRTTALIKVKKAIEYTATVLDVYEGAGRLVNTMGALHCCTKVDNKLVFFNVGSGFSDDERWDFWTNDYTNKNIIVEAFGVSVDRFGNQSLNCPIYHGKVE